MIGPWGADGTGRRAIAGYREADILDVQGRAAAGGEMGMRKKGMRERGRQRAALNGRLLNGEEGGGWYRQRRKLCWEGR